MSFLIVFSGLSGTGKSTIAQEVARRIGAAYLRVDSIEQAMRDSGAGTGPIQDGGYRVAYSLAEDNLSLGTTVVADCVNPIGVTRDAWMEVATRIQAKSIEIEVKCSDPQQHRFGVENRQTEVPGLRLPTWEEVTTREYEP